VLIFFVLCCSCTNKQHTDKPINDTVPQFQINVKPLDIESDISKAVLFHGDIVCLLKNGKINVFDSLYHHKKEVEVKLANLKFDDYPLIFLYRNNLIIRDSNNKLQVLDYLYNHNSLVENNFKIDAISFLSKYRDSFYAIGKKNIYYIPNNGPLIKINMDNFWATKKYMAADQLYEDNSYDVRECCAGEFGGNVFFVNKKTNRVTLYPATCASEIIKVNAGYFMSESLQHLAGTTEYSIILNPEKLPEPHSTKGTNDKAFGCNCDTLNTEHYWYNYFERKKIEFIHSVYNYYWAVEFTTVFTFKYKNDLFSIQVGDSILRLVSHKNYNVRAIDTINFDQTNSLNPSIKVDNNSPKYLGLCKSGYWSRKTALIVAQGNKIDILEYKNGL